MEYSFLLTFPQGDTFAFSNINKLEIEKKYTNTSGEALESSYSSVFRNCYDIVTLAFIESISEPGDSDKLSKLMPILEEFSKTTKEDPLFMILTCSIEDQKVFSYFVMLSDYTITQTTKQQAYACSFIFIGSKRPPRINSEILTSLGTPLPVTTGKFQI